MSVCLLTLAMVPTLPALAAAQAAQSSAKDQAKAAYQEGATAFKAKDFATALGHFERAYKLDPSPILLYNMARAHEEMGASKKAIENFELYLARVPKTADRAEIEGRVTALKAAIVDAPPPEEPMSLAPYAYTALGLGGALTVVGVIYGLKTNTAEDEHHSATVPKDKAQFADDAESFSGIANFGFIAGGVLLATGATLWILDDAGESGVSVLPTPTGTVLGYSTSF